MTEAEWLACESPWPMIRFVQERNIQRNIRLFACGCVRTVWNHLTDPRSRRRLLRLQSVRSHADANATQEEGPSRT